MDEERLFFDRFVALLKSKQEEYGTDDIHDAFIIWFAEACLRIDPEDTKERIRSDKHAEGIDAILLEEGRKAFYLVQAKTVVKFKETKKQFPVNAVKLTLGGARLVLNDELGSETSPDFKDLVKDFQAKDRTGDYETTVLFLSLKRNFDDTKYVKSFRKEYPSVKVVHYGFHWLMKFYNHEYLLAKAEPPSSITLPSVSKSVEKSTPRQARVFTTRAVSLAKAYSNYREGLLQGNVRYYLGRRVNRGINEGIVKTAEGAKSSKNFWYYNNGVTFVCERIKPTSTNKGFKLYHPQIINGAQTTYALYEAYNLKKLQKNTEILVKVIESDDAKFMNAVTLYTNSQNPIALRDLASNDAIQIRIQRALEPYRYFYEIKRGEFNLRYETEVAKSNALGPNYKGRIMSNEGASQAYLAMFKDRPAEARNLKRRIFLKSEEGFYGEIFDKPKQLLPERMLVAWKLLGFIREKEREYRREYKKAADYTAKKRDRVYRFDFILHSEYFILNLFGDFLKHSGVQVQKSKSSMLKVVKMVENDDDTLTGIYDKIRSKFATFMSSKRKSRAYTHNRFFKSETSLAEVREYFHKKYPFVRED